MDWPFWHDLTFGVPERITPSGVERALDLPTAEALAARVAASEAGLPVDLEPGNQARLGRRATRQDRHDLDQHFLPLGLANLHLLDLERAVRRLRPWRGGGHVEDRPGGVDRRERLARRFACPIGIDTDVNAAALASNAVGTINDVRRVADAAHVRCPTLVAVAEGDLRMFVSFGFNAGAEKAAETTLPPFNRLGAKMVWLRYAYDQTAPYCILSVAILVESPGMRELVDRILVVDVPQSLQMERLQRRDQVDQALALKMMAAQATREQRLAAADEVIVNDGSVEQTVAAVARLHQRYLAQTQAAPHPDR